MEAEGNEAIREAELVEEDNKKGARKSHQKPDRGHRERNCNT